MHASERGPENRDSRLMVLSLAALGVVFGDIGTSPLYALRECFFGSTQLPVNEANVLGVLSLIFWTLICVISIKYQTVVLKADNRGEGGILALLALLDPWHSSQGGNKPKTLVILAIIGASLLYGEGVITPAISVLSAVEGLEVAAPGLAHYVIPITVVILIGVFLLQSGGTHKVGALFGPVMVVWFSVLTILGLLAIGRNPAVLAALNPLHAVNFFIDNKMVGFFTIGAVFLVVTGGEALYVDLGHFGRKPIRRVWFFLVLPALVINYLGQGALLLTSGGAIKDPFFALAPEWGLYPLIILATMATVIASQAVISGVFSLTNQAIQLGQAPRMNVVQTSPNEIGQIYIPFLNWVMMLTTIALVLGFKSSSNLISAYGISISTAMLITSLLTFFVMSEKWQWPRPAALAIAGLFALIDLSFFSANVVKIEHGGWFSVLVALLVYTLMSTWSSGRQAVINQLRGSVAPLDEFLSHFTAQWPLRVPGTAIFMTAPDLGVPPILQYHLMHNQVLHERVILLTVVTEDEPWVPASKRLKIVELSHGFYRVHVTYGFMQSPNLPVALRLGERLGLTFDPEATSYYLGRETLTPHGSVSRMMRWRQMLFAVMARNAVRATDFFKLPPYRTVELGMRLELMPMAYLGLKPHKKNGNGKQSEPDAAAAPADSSIVP